MSLQLFASLENDPKNILPREEKYRARGCVLLLV